MHLWTQLTVPGILLLAVRGVLVVYALATLVFVFIEKPLDTWLRESPIRLGAVDCALSYGLGARRQWRAQVAVGRHVLLLPHPRL